jgi:hypothetical protein
VRAASPTGGALRAVIDRSPEQVPRSFGAFAGYKLTVPPQLLDGKLDWRTT